MSYVDYFQKQIYILQKTDDGFSAINLTDYLDYKLIRYLIKKYRDYGKVAPFVKEGRKLAIKSLYIDFEMLLDIQEFLIDCKDNRKGYCPLLIKLLRKINYIVEMKG